MRKSAAVVYEDAPRNVDERSPLDSSADAEINGRFFGDNEFSRRRFEAVAKLNYDTILELELRKLLYVAFSGRRPPGSSSTHPTDEVGPPIFWPFAYATVSGPVLPLMT